MPEVPPALPVDPISVIIDLGTLLFSIFAPIPKFDLFNPDTWWDPNVWFGFGGGLPDQVKTLQTAHRLSLSQIPLVVGLGLHFGELAALGKILSRPSDVADFFGPAMTYTTTTLRPDLPLGALSLDNVVFRGDRIAQFDQHYFDLKSPLPYLVNPQQFQTLRPGKKFPQRFYDHLVKIWPKLSHCPPGYSLNLATEQCEQNAPPPPPVCPPGYSLINGICVYGPKPSGCGCAPPRSKL